MYYDLKVQTIEEVSPIQVYPARVLSHLFSHLGTCIVHIMLGPLSAIGLHLDWILV